MTETQTADARAVQQPGKNLRVAAMNLLARREHSRQELERKLISKLAPDAGQLGAVLDRLEQDGLLSDSRYAEAFCNARMRVGKGPVRIRVELRERGVAEDLVESVLRELNVDWVMRAREVLQKRFGSGLSPDQRATAQRMRFLQYRGFTSEQIRAALKSTASLD